ncbi:MAG TPA: hypothetical protein VMV60_05485 [Thermoanaerobaculia bacterium]|nr:hypothetical protein [Thermoanaerobaculia bacterium]
MIAAMLAEAFLKVVEKATADLDIDDLRAEVRAFSQKHADLTTREMGERLVAVAARRAAALGAAASLPPGWLALATVAPELTAVLVLQSRLIVSLHVLYGGPMTPEERALEVLAGLAAGAGMNVGRRLTTRAAEEVAERLVLRLAGREVSHVVPVLGALAGAGLNYAAVRAVGRAALRRIEKLYGPPEIPGAGPVLDVRGRVA